MDLGSGDAILHKHDLFYDPRAPELHQVWQTRPQLLEVEMEARGMQTPAVRPREVPRSHEEQIPGICGGLLG